MDVPMDIECPHPISCPAKLVRVVLANCGPLSPSEAATEARISVEQAADAVQELVEHDLAKPVCGVCDAKEVVYELTENGERRA